MLSANRLLHFSIHSKWSQIVTEEPEGRIGHTLCTDTEENNVILYGGVNDAPDSTSKYLDDMHIYNFCDKTWSRMQLIGNVQAARAFHTAVFFEGLMYIFGGCNGRGRFNKLFSVTVDGLVTTIDLQRQASSPATRYCHSATVFDNKMYVYAGKCGGRNSNKRLQDLWCFDFNTKTWLECTQSGTKPSPRSAHAAFTFGRSMIVFGGRNEQGECCDDLFCYNYDTGVWTNIDVRQQSLFGRARHSVSVHNGKVVVFGGWNGKKKLNDLFFFNMDSQTFEVVADQDEAYPSRRECHVAVTCKNTMVVFGGRFRGNFMSDTCELELGTKSLKDNCRDFLLTCYDALSKEEIPLRITEYYNKHQDYIKKKK